ncbi:hypothetical protein CSA80_02160 [Candidatus Saccharibacteria bacterium]|nr:MAG: hypothetical protein CR973_02570 [Candidatus Saccharibacteria bacterium]PID99541.1 MAG: hypothetical protein CSA80_02160 [Candidatus Saccharibacteria bacterium]
MADQQKPTLVITGAAGGLGRELSRVASDAGYHVYGVVRSDDDEVSSGTQKIIADLEDPEAVKAGFRAIAADSQSSNIAVIANAGKYVSLEVSEWTAEVFRDMWNANFITALNTTIAAQEVFASGRVVYLLGQNAFEPNDGSGPYGVAKMAINRMVESLRLEDKGRPWDYSLIASGSINTWSDTAEPETIDINEAAQEILRVALWNGTSAPAFLLMTPS